MNQLNSENIIILVLACGAGLILGALYFTALWRTVKKLPESVHPFRLMIGSFVLRMAIVLPGFYLVMSGHWERLAAALVGFILARLVITRRLGLERAA